MSSADSSLVEPCDNDDDSMNDGDFLYSNNDNIVEDTMKECLGYCQLPGISTDEISVTTTDSFDFLLGVTENDKDDAFFYY